MTSADQLLNRIAPHHRLLLAATLSETDPARRAWSAWRVAVAFDDVDPPAVRLLPILAKRPDVIDAEDPLLGRIRGLYRKSWVSNERLLAASKSARTALVGTGIPILHVEAIPLARAVGDHATRPLHDIDICIPRHSMHTTLEILDGQGWQLANPGFRTRWLHRPRHLIRDDARLRLIDRVPWPGADASVWETSSIDESGERVLDVHDAVVHAAVRSVQPWQQPPAYWVADLVRLTSSLGYRRAADALGDEQIAARAKAHESSTTVTAALEAADRMIGAQLRTTGE